MEWKVQRASSSIHPTGLGRLGAPGPGYRHGPQPPRLPAWPPTTPATGMAPNEPGLYVVRLRPQISQKLFAPHQEKTTNFVRVKQPAALHSGLRMSLQPSYFKPCAQSPASGGFALVRLGIGQSRLRYADPSHNHSSNKSDRLASAYGLASGHAEDFRAGRLPVLFL